MLTAIQAFVSSIGCFKTRYDEQLIVYNGNEIVNFEAFTAQENQGKTLYNTNCASCHNLGAVASSIGIVAANNGLDQSSLDGGIGALSNNPDEVGHFKVPLLRNIELTGPYMHDGRFAKLEQVVEHYSSGIKNHPNLHENLIVGGMGFNEIEKQALVAFLETLTDTESLAAVRYSDPFKQ